MVQRSSVDQRTQIAELCAVFIVNVSDDCLMRVCVPEGSSNAIPAKPRRALDDQRIQGDAASADGAGICLEQIGHGACGWRWVARCLFFTQD